MEVHFNLNDVVYVKLKPTGIAELKKQHKDLLKTFPGLDEFEYPKEDSEGYSKWQMYQLMGTFGHLLGLGLPEPFNLNIKVDVEDRVELETFEYSLDVAKMQYIILPTGTVINDVIVRELDKSFTLNLVGTKPELSDGFDEYQILLIWESEGLIPHKKWIKAGQVIVYNTLMHVYYRIAMEK